MPIVLFTWLEASRGHKIDFYRHFIPAYKYIPPKGQHNMIKFVSLKGPLEDDTKCSHYDSRETGNKWTETLQA